MMHRAQCYWQVNHVLVTRNLLSCCIYPGISWLLPGFIFMYIICFMLLCNWLQIWRLLIKKRYIKRHEKNIPVVWICWHNNQTFESTPNLSATSSTKSRFCEFIRKNSQFRAIIQKQFALWWSLVKNTPIWGLKCVPIGKLQAHPFILLCILMSWCNHKEQKEAPWDHN